MQIKNNTETIKVLGESVNTSQLLDNNIKIMIY
jgi:hypothetical protein